MLSWTHLPLTMVKRLWIDQTQAPIRSSQNINTSQDTRLKQEKGSKQIAPNIYTLWHNKINRKMFKHLSLTKKREEKNQIHFSPPPPQFFTWIRKIEWRFGWRIDDEYRIMLHHNDQRRHDDIHAKYGARKDMSSLVKQAGNQPFPSVYIPIG